MFKRFILYIEQEPWEEAIDRWEAILNRAIIGIMFFAAIYFSPFIINIITR